jgi:uncharacterized membrane protein YhaH (DUF805 family)
MFIEGHVLGSVELYVAIVLTVWFWTSLYFWCLFLDCIAKRQHDIGYSVGIPVVVFILLICSAAMFALVTKITAGQVFWTISAIVLTYLVGLAVIPGQRGPNDFGPDPREPMPMAHETLEGEEELPVY